MRTKRFLLVTAALVACGKTPATPEKTDAEVLPLPANPKGSFYDAGIEPTPTDTPTTPDAGAPKDAGTTNPPPPPIKDAGAIIKPHPLPANPKGSFYDGGRKKTDPGF